MLESATVDEIEWLVNAQYAITSNIMCSNGQHVSLIVAPFPLHAPSVIKTHIVVQKVSAVAFHLESYVV